MLGKRSKTTNGNRTGTLLMAGGAVMALASAALVLSVGRGAQAAPEAGQQPVREQMVVVATKDIAELATIKPDAVALKPFPVGYAPAGAAVKVEDIVGKVATTPIVRDQLILQPQVATIADAKTPSIAIPADKVVFWMPLPDLIAQSNALRAGDKVDILLSIGIAPVSTQASSGSRSITTQATLQAVEVYAIGSTFAALTPDAKQLTAPQPTQQVKAAAFLLSPQDAVLAKYIKDSNGTIDLVLRSREAHDPFSTEAVTADTLVDRFQFRVPQRWTTGK